MTHADHERLLAALTEASGYVAVSGYRCSLYDEALAGWRRLDFDVANHSGQGRSKQRRIESLWTNWASSGGQ